MTLGFIGRKCGMTSVFDETGGPVPVTVVEAAPNRVTQVKTVKKDGYSAVQVATGAVRASLLSKAEIGHFAKAGVVPGYGLWEFRIDAADEGKFAVGQEISVEMFKVGDIVAVSGVSKGKGMAGAIKRWGFSKQRASHGNSLAHRAPGSIGQNQDPGRVPKGKKMAGHMGNENVTMRKLKVVRVDNELKVLLIKGAVPGCNGGVLRIVPLV